LTSEFAASADRRRALFLDRDGVINHEVGYLHLPRDVRFVDGIFALARTAQGLGYKLVVVTNQSGIARGFYTTQQFVELMDWMRAEFAREGVTLDAVYHCPYHPIHGVGEFQRESPDRKPSPGMLLRAAADLNLDLHRSILVGDRCSDIAAARAARLQQAFLIAGTETDICPIANVGITTLAEVENWLKANAGKAVTEIDRQIKNPD
jgi:D-glycero-D-manno-heptose 1,7-bisphosphate phosphatase